MKKKINKRILAAILSVSMCVGGGLSSLNVFAEDTNAKDLNFINTVSDNSEDSSVNESSNIDDDTNTGNDSGASNSSDISDDSGASNSSDISDDSSASNSSDISDDSSASNGFDVSNDDSNTDENSNIVPSYDYIPGESKWKLSNVVNDQVPTSAGIDIDISHISKDGYIIYTIPADYSENLVHINATADIEQLLAGTYVPGWESYFSIKIINLSEKIFAYADNTFYVSTPFVGEKEPSDPIYSYDPESDSATIGWLDGVTGFDGRSILCGNNVAYGINRTCNTAIQALYGLDRQLSNDSKVNRVKMADEALEAALIEAGYSGGIADLNRYYIDYYNQKYGENVTRLEDFSYDILKEIFDGNRFNNRETNVEIAETGYNWFYNLLLAAVPEGVKYTSTDDSYSIGAWMSGSTEYEKQLREGLAEVANNEEGYETGRIKISLNGPYTVNAYMDFEFGWSIGLDLVCTDTSYSVVHEYYTSTDGGAFVLDGSVPSTESIKANVGDVVKVADLKTAPAYNGNTYTYKSAEPSDELTVVSDPEKNVITLRYERTVTTTSSTPSTPDDPYIPRPRPEPSTPSEEEIVDESTPLSPPEDLGEVITDEDVPLSPPVPAVTEEIFEDEIPLAAAPKTGSAAGSALVVLGAALGLGLVITRKKK